MKKVSAKGFFFFSQTEKKNNSAFALSTPLFLNPVLNRFSFFVQVSYHQRTTELSQLSSSPREQISFVSSILEKNKKKGKSINGNNNNNNTAKIAVARIERVTTKSANDCHYFRLCPVDSINY